METRRAGAGAEIVAVPGNLDDVIRAERLDHYFADGWQPLSEGRDSA